MKQSNFSQALQWCIEYAKNKGAVELEDRCSLKIKDYTFSFRNSVGFNVFGRFDTARVDLGNKFSGKYNLHTMSQEPIDIFTEFKAHLQAAIR